MINSPLTAHYANGSDCHIKHKTSFSLTFSHTQLKPNTRQTYTFTHIPTTTLSTNKQNTHATDMAIRCHLDRQVKYFRQNGDSSAALTQTIINQEKILQTKPKPKPIPKQSKNKPYIFSRSTPTIQCHLNRFAHSTHIDLTWGATRINRMVTVVENRRHSLSRSILIWTLEHEEHFTRNGSIYDCHRTALGISESAS